jgi:general secretion pathway protein N
MKKWIKWTLLWLGFYLVCLIAYLPANQVISRINLPASIQLSGISGTVWKGSVKQFVYKGIPVKDFNWQLGFSSLLFGKASVQINAGQSDQDGQISFEGRAKIALTDISAINAQNVELYLPANRLFGQLPLPLPINGGGRFKLEIERLDYQGKCVSLTGQGQWVNAQIVFNDASVQLGQFRAKAECEQDNVAIIVEEPNRLGLSFKALLTPALTFSLDGQFKMDENLPPAFHQAATFFGEADNQGYRGVSL